MKTLSSLSLLAAAVALLTFGAPMPAFSEMKDMPMKEHQEAHGQMAGTGTMDTMGDMTGMCIAHADRIGFTDAQMLKIRPVHSELQKKQVRFKADVTIAEIELMEVMEVKDFDLEKANAAVRKIAGILMAHHLELVKSIKEIRSIVTDEQFREMKKMMSMKPCEKKP